MMLYLEDCITSKVSLEIVVVLGRGRGNASEIVLEERDDKRVAIYIRYLK
jgi:hypothetical protein